MEWILIAGALCLSSHHDICFKQVDGYPFGFTVTAPKGVSIPADKLSNALYLGETFGKMADHDAADAAKRAGGGMTFRYNAFGQGLTPCPNGGVVVVGDTCPTEASGGSVAPLIIGDAAPGTFPPLESIGVGNVFMNSAPYGMSKEEFGAFIEQHAKKGAADMLWSCYGLPSAEHARCDAVLK